MPSGIILKGIGGFYYVKTPEGIYECKARGIFRKEDLAPLPGDNVTISIQNESTKKGNIEEIQKRHSQLIRPAVANVNQLLIILAAKSPAPDLYMLDKLLITARQKALKVVIGVNKIDLDEKEEYKTSFQAYIHAGYKLVLLSSKTKTGYDVLQKELNQWISVFAGQSGVGKSTILNHIMDEEVMQTGGISERIDRGKHTTRHAQLVELATGGYVVDTPGFTSLLLPEVSFTELEQFYPEFETVRNQCRFANCSHVNEPECAVKNAVKEKIIDQGRYDRYIVFYEQLKENHNKKWK